MRNARSAGLVLALLSAAAFSTSGPLAGSLIRAGWSPAAAVVARLVVGVGVVWGLVAAVGLAVYYVLASDGGQPLPPLVLSCAALWVGALVLAGLALAGLIPFRAASGPVTLANQQVSWLVPVLGLSL